MKPNGQQFVLRAVLFVALGLFASVASAETVHGNFKLNTPARWGQMVLAPGEYEFAVETQGPNQMLTIRSKDSGWSGMVMALGLSDGNHLSTSRLELARSSQGVYVRKLYLNDFGLALDFATPKGGRVTRLANATSTLGASASGSH